MHTDIEFSRKRLPHLEGMSEQQHALITLINAACYVTDEESKQIVFARLCGHVGIEGELVAPTCPVLFSTLDCAVLRSTTLLPILP